MRLAKTEKSTERQRAPFLHLAAVVSIILGSRVLMMLVLMFVSAIKISWNSHYAPRTVFTALKHSSILLIIVPESRTHQSPFTHDEIRLREAA